MNKLIAHPIYTWFGLIGAKVASLIGIYSATNKKEVAGMDAGTWFEIAGLYLLFVIASLGAQIVINLKKSEET